MGTIHSVAMSYPIMDTAIVMTVFVWIWFVSLFNVKIEKYDVWHILPTKNVTRQNIVFYVMGGG